jgi:hypothetical protein
MAEQGNKIAEKVKEVAKQELQDLQKVTEEGARSGAYLYPIRGMVYFASHRSIWKPMMRAIGPSLATAAAIFPAMFFFTYLPQVAVLTLVNGPLAVFSTVLLVLSESSTIFSIVSKNFFINEALVETFDGVLVSKGLSSLVSKDRKLDSGSNSDPMSRLGKTLSKPFANFSPTTSLVRYFMFLPLNLIPIVGTVLFVVLQGKKFGPHAHARYFQLKQMSESQREQFVEKRSGAYTSFGIVATLLEMVPLAGLFFAYTNTVGAALWAADMEKGETTAPSLREAVKKAE